LGNILHIAMSKDANGSLQVMQNVADNLRQARLQQGYSQERLASRAGISRRMLVNIEAGESNASIATVDKLASALGLSFVDVVRPPSLSDKAGALPLRIWQGEQADSHASLLESVPMPGMALECGAGNWRPVTAITPRPTRPAATKCCMCWKAAASTTAAKPHAASRAVTDLCLGPGVQLSQPWHGGLRLYQEHPDVSARRCRTIKNGPRAVSSWC
jgi:transcriptional regulator with XRE-family HTH domain